MIRHFVHQSMFTGINCKTFLYHFGFVAYVYLLPSLGVLNSNFVALMPKQTVTLILWDVIKNPGISHSKLHEGDGPLPRNQCI